MATDRPIFQAARDLLASAHSICILTGAGISAESGVPTFRGAAGLWRNHRAEQLATPEAFARDPKTVWEWYDWRRTLVAKAKPNAGHLAIARLQSDRAATLVTQNVDGLHDLALEQTNSPQARPPLKLHGDLWTLRCTGCGTERTDRRAPLPSLPPLCESCGAMERPSVVWFGEALPVEAWEISELAARTADVFLVVGTSAVVYPAAGLAHLAKSVGAKVIEINPEQTPLSNTVDLAWRAPAAEALPQLLG